MEKLHKFLKDALCTLTLEHFLIAAAFSLAAFAGATIIIGALKAP